jgi:hypothetical protein
MAFLGNEGVANRFQGDILSLNYIKPTIEAKSVLIPGVTCAFDVEVKGQTAYYYESDSFIISDGDAGRKLDLELTGAKRKSFDLDKSYGIGGIIPMVGKDTLSEDIVGRKLVDSAKGVVAKDNAKGLAAMINGITVWTYPKADTAYQAVVDAIVHFNEVNKVAFTSKTIDGTEATSNETAKGGWVAKTLIVGPAFYGALQKCEEFVKGNAEFSVNEAVVGRCAGLDVVYAPELPSTCEFVVMSPDGFIAPKGVSATEVFGQVEGRPGAALAQAEMVYAYKQLDVDQILPCKKAAN